MLSQSIQQVVGNAGDGNLRDGSDCSLELRSFLREVTSETLARYADYCLTNSFNKSGQVLQDVVNELGRRLDYQVANGLYQGSSTRIGNDGLWKAPDGHELLVEVKTTDTYRISLDTIARYRDKLLATRQIADSNSVLIVVGRKDTGELEAQVRGSRHAWDMRLISVDSLIRLVLLKENTEETETAEKIRSVLRPLEYTRLDALIDVMFTAARDVDEKSDERQPAGDAERSGQSGWEFTAPELIQAKRHSIIAALGEQLHVKFVKKTRATYWDSSKETRVVCTISKRYGPGNTIPYWYAYHPDWDEFLKGGRTGIVAFGAMDLERCFAIPLPVLQSHLDDFNTSTKSDGSKYWHVKILEPVNGQFSLQVAKTGKHVPLKEFEVPLTAAV